MLETAHKRTGNTEIAMYVVVIGGANIDIGGRPYAPLIAADSNPGKISTGLGGVGRNIAHALSKLGVNVFLVTAIGDDYSGKFIKERCEEAGIDMKYALTVEGETSSMYLYINDYDGDMSLALSHMDIVKNITPEYIESLTDLIRGSAAVVADGNLTQEVFLKVKEICNKNEKCVPIYLDPVSTAHAHKIKDHLDGIYTIKPNRLEAEYLTDMTISTVGDYRAAANELIRQGVKRVFISMGEKGMFAADKDGSYIIDKFPCDVISTTGAGDSATAGLVWASTHGQSITQSAAAANAVASMIISSPQTINPELSAETVRELIDSCDISITKI